jgi:hypothetical protein
MTKTCGECKHCENQKIIATCKHVGVTTGDVSGSNCKWFEPKVITNGDKIIAGGMRAIAEVAKKRCQHCIYKNCDLEAVCLEVDCADGIEAWLNAPAESEGMDE